jgi:hypothetical protein
LTQLQIFAADRNQLTGSLPSFANVPRLYSFTVAYNPLTGGIPSLSTPSMLNTFSIGHNQLFGMLPSNTFTDAAASQALDIGNNHFSGPIPVPPATLTEGLVCANQFDLDPSAAWDAVTGSSPWWATPTADNQCNDLFNDSFELE